MYDECGNSYNTEPQKRPSKREYYLEKARVTSTRSTCNSSHYGAVIVNNDQVVADGYNGSPRGHVNCCDSPGICKRIQNNIKSGDGYDCCVAVHAEMNAIISAGRKLCIGGDLYLYGSKVDTGLPIENATPCNICMGVIINAGIKRVITNNKVLEV